MVIVVLAVVIFFFDNLKGNMSVPLTKQSGISCFKNSCGISVENRCVKQLMTFFLIDKNTPQPIPIHIMEQVLGVKGIWESGTLKGKGKKKEQDLHRPRFGGRGKAEALDLTVLPLLAFGWHCWPKIAWLLSEW